MVFFINAFFGYRKGDSIQALLGRYTVLRKLYVAVYDLDSTLFTIVSEKSCKPAHYNIKTGKAPILPRLVSTECVYYVFAFVKPIMTKTMVFVYNP